jgi:transposase
MFLRMSGEEFDRASVIREVVEGRLTQRRAAELLLRSERHVRRMVQRYRSEGPEGLIHRARGRPSNRRISEEARSQAAALMHEDAYGDYGPTLLSEALMQTKGIKLSNETVRRLMIAEGLWEPRKAKAQPRQWRERKARFGEMVQMDTSIHDWFEGRGEKAVLIAIIDDATSRLFCRFYPTDSTATNMACLREYIRAYGLPRSLYVDRASHFVTTREASIDEQLSGKQAQTQIQRALAELKIVHITAYSPQAKGRVERCFGTLQDRLVKAMRQVGIAAIDEANAYLEQVFVPMWNEQFTCEPREKVDAHRSRAGFDLDAIFSHQDTRYVCDDYTFSYDSHKCQIEERSVAAGLRRSRVTIEERLDGTRRVRWRGRYLRWHVLPESSRNKAAKKKRKAEPAACGAKTRRKPAPDHPWRRRRLPKRKKDDAA